MKYLYYYRLSSVEASTLCITKDEIYKEDEECFILYNKFFGNRFYVEKYRLNQIIDQKFISDEPLSNEKNKKVHTDLLLHRIQYYKYKMNLDAFDKTVIHPAIAIMKECCDMIDKINF